jgi:diguanylate cyclase (GGDEF)-like protein
MLDTAALRVREATISAGAWLTYALCGASAGYIAITWHGPHRAFLALLFAVATAFGFAISLLPRERIVRSRYREHFFLTWTVLDLVLIASATFADNGARSPLALMFLVPMVFAATTYPLRSVVTVAVLTVGLYLALSLVAGHSAWGQELLFTVVLACAGAMSAWQADQHDRQRRALSAISRTDALTGCLNRRGFEERAAGEIASAQRLCREGAILVLDLDDFKTINDHAGHAAGDALLCWVVQTLERVTRTADAVGRIGGDEFAVLFAEVDSATALINGTRIAQALAERAPCSIGLAAFPLDGTDLETLMRQADARLYASREGRVKPPSRMPDERLSWAAALAHAVDLRMNPEHEHSVAVSDLAVGIAIRLGWRTERLGMLRIAAMLHDVGKVNVPDYILGKPGPLGRDEFETMMLHTNTGAELVARIDGLDEIVPWIRHSHESFDGSGYPDSLSGGDIPQASRILLVADAFDAMTSERPYRKAMPLEQAREELLRNAGTQFDPTCVHALLDHLDATASEHAGTAREAAARRA